jgi:flagellar biogenesis protein FliO
MIDGSVVGTLVRLVLSLAAVLTLMVFLARYLHDRQIGVGLGAGAAQRRKKANLLEVVTRQGLSRGSSVAIVRVSGQLMLLGVTESAVTVLRELEDIEEPELVQEPALVNGASLDSADSPHSSDRIGNGAHRAPRAITSGRAPVQTHLGLPWPHSGSVLEMLRQWTVRRG